MRIFNEVHQNDPEFFAELIVPVFADLFKTVDFAEIKEFVDGSNADIKALMQQVNEILWQYPSKVVAVAAVLPSLINITAESLNITFDKLNQLPPDLLIDIVVALLFEFPQKVAISDVTFWGKCLGW